MEECSDIRVEGGVMPTELKIDESIVEDSAAYPISIKLCHLSEQEATPDQVATSANGKATQDGIFRSNLSKDDTDELIQAARLDDKANTEDIVHANYMLGVLIYRIKVHLKQSWLGNGCLVLKY